MKFKGGFAQKVSTMGTYRKGIGFTHGGATKGAADMIITFAGKVLHLEIKFSKSDVQRESQKVFQANVEMAGGTYRIVRTLDEFIDVFEEVFE